MSSQAYGTGKLKLVGVWLQIFLLYGTLVAFPLMGLRHLTSPVLRGFGMERRFFSERSTRISNRGVVDTFVRGVVDAADMFPNTLEHVKSTLQLLPTNTACVGALGSIGSSLGWVRSLGRLFRHF